MCLCTYKLKASGQETGLESNLGSLTSIFKQVLAGLLNPSFNKSYMRLLSKKQKKKKENNSSGYKRLRRIQAEQA